MPGDGASIKKPQKEKFIYGRLKCLLEQKTVHYFVILIRLIDVVFVFQFTWPASFTYQRGSKRYKERISYGGSL